MLGDHAHGARALQVAQQAQRLAMVLADLVLDVADAGVGDRQLGQFAVARWFEDGPAGRRNQVVDALLVVAVRHRLRGACALNKQPDGRAGRTVRGIFDRVHSCYSRSEEARVRTVNSTGLRARQRRRASRSTG